MMTSLAQRRVSDRWANVSGYCLCRKTPYITLRVAERAAAAAEARDEGRHRVYHCPNRRRTWHITHVAPRGRAAEELEQ